MAMQVDEASIETLVYSGGMKESPQMTALVVSDSICHGVSIKCQYHGMFSKPVK